MIDVTGNWATGMIDQRFIIQTKKNSETTSGTYFSPSFLPMRLVDDAAADEVVAGLGDHLELAGDDLRLAEGRPEEADDDDRAEQGQQHRLVEVQVAVRVAPERLEQERVQAGSREATTGRRCGSRSRRRAPASGQHSPRAPSAWRIGTATSLCRRGAQPRFGTGLVLRMWGRLVRHRASRLSRRQLRCPRPQCRSWHRTIAGSRTRTYPGPTLHDDDPVFSGFSPSEESGST